MGKTALFKASLLALSLSLFSVEGFAASWMCGVDYNGDSIMDATTLCKQGQTSAAASAYLCPYGVSDCSLSKWRCESNSQEYSDQASCVGSCRQTAVCSKKIWTKSKGTGLISGSGSICSDYSVYYRVFRQNDTTYLLQLLDMSPSGVAHHNCDSGGDVGGWHTIKTVTFTPPLGTLGNATPTVKFSVCKSTVSLLAPQFFNTYCAAQDIVLNQAYRVEQWTHSAAGTGTLKYVYSYTITLDAELYSCPLDNSIACSGNPYSCQIQANCTKIPVCPQGFNCDCTSGTQATCPSGGSLNVVSDRCEINPAGLCPGTTSYDSSLNGCVGNPLCDAPGAYDKTANRCEFTARYLCPAGYRYNSAASRCENRLKCPPGSRFDAQAGLCKSTGQICNAGYGLDTATNRCFTPSTCATGILNTARDKCEINPVCAPGTIYSVTTDTCRTIPDICPVGSFYNTTFKRCERNADVSGYACATGYVWNFARKKCESPPSCPSGSSYDTAANRCRKTAYKGCPAGYSLNGNVCTRAVSCGYGTWDTVKDGCYGDIRCGSASYLPEWRGLYCTAQYSCPSGSSYYSWIKVGSMYHSVKQCIHDNYPPSKTQYSCPTGYSLNYRRTYHSGFFRWWESKYFCSRVPDCPVGGSWDYYLGSCTSPANCPAGTTQGTWWKGEGTLCSSAGSCYQGGSLNTTNDICEKPSFWYCPSGFGLGGNVCYKNAVCSSGGVLDVSVDRCQTAGAPVYSCAPGWTLSGMTCYKAPSCQVGTSMNTTTGMCEAPPVCPAGMTLYPVSDKCGTTPQCPSAMTYSSTYDRCEKPAVTSCPTGAVYNQSTGYCEASLSCPAGGIFSRTDPLLCVHTATPDCPVGYAYEEISSSCVQPAKCASGILDGGSDKCLVSGDNLCPPEYVFSPSLDVCTGNPQCVSGSYDKVNDKCCSCSSPNSCIDTAGNGNYRCSPNKCTDIGNQANVTTGNVDLTYLRNDGGVGTNGQCLGTQYLFNGKPVQCRDSGVQTTFSDCCRGGPGLFGMAPNCKPEEAGVVAAKAGGRCRYIGQYCMESWFLVGCVQTARVYCCFNSKLGRIIHEQGRPQLKSFGLNGGWGNTSSPNCIGFTPEQFQSLDMSSIDLSGFFGDIVAPNSGALKQNMSDSMKNYYGNIK